jgi:DNA polymerase-3 subunit beta
MKVSCLQENLAKGLSIVGRAVSTRTTLPVLNNVLMATDKNRLKLAATNLELGITCWIGAKVEEEGATTVPARTLTDLVSSLPADRIDMTLNVRNQTLELRCARTEARIKGIDAQEFPLMPSADGDLPGAQTALIRVEDLRDLINQVVFAAATDESRPILTGVYVELNGDRITMAAADGFRLSVRHAKLVEPVQGQLTLVIPARALNEVARVSADEQNPVAIKVIPGRGQVLFHMTNVELVSQLIEGNFPDYNRIIPKTHSTRLMADTAQFRKACRTADIFARESAHTARISIAPGEDVAPGRLTVTATSAETGDNVGELDAIVEGPAMDIAFNVRYLMDVLDRVDTGQTALELTTSSSPGVIKAVGNEDFLHVIMPMHLSR